MKPRFMIHGDTNGVAVLHIPLRLANTLAEFGGSRAELVTRTIAAGRDDAVQALNCLIEDLGIVTGTTSRRWLSWKCQKALKRKKI